MREPLAPGDEVQYPSVGDVPTAADLELPERPPRVPGYYGQTPVRDPGAARQLHRCHRQPLLQGPLLPRPPRQPRQDGSHRPVAVPVPREADGGPEALLPGEEVQPATRAGDQSQLAAGQVGQDKGQERVGQLQQLQQLRRKTAAGDGGGGGGGGQGGGAVVAVLQGLVAGIQRGGSRRLGPSLAGVGSRVAGQAERRTRPGPGGGTGSGSREGGGADRLQLWNKYQEFS